MSRRGETRLRYLVGVDLAFLAETWRHVLGLDLLLGHVVLVEEMLVLHLWAQTEVRPRACWKELSSSPHPPG